ncbi:hypothetical protein NPIL_473711 [Nephila pilipes]|uniref:Uncharacterized protein n=1 Tax=Nephila pilipes TaxID=299642 RepID=A0A8X6TAE9_NEPPI|nr:hypothetical protein NPIL_473711 [Nephila pilipes]
MEPSISVCGRLCPSQSCNVEANVRQFLRKGKRKNFFFLPLVTGLERTLKFSKENFVEYSETSKPLTLFAATALSTSSAKNFINFVMSPSAKFSSLAYTNQLRHISCGKARSIIGAKIFPYN